MKFSSTPVLFLDRDGVINRERGDYTWEIDQFEFNKGIFDLLKLYKSKGFQFIIITNQGGIKKERYTKSHVDELHAFMIAKIKEKGFDVLDVFYCPHHSDFEKCLCRKPGSLMFEKAIARYNVDVENSIMIGDNQRDLIPAVKCGLKTILVESNCLDKVINNKNDS